MAIEIDLESAEGFGPGRIRVDGQSLRHFNASMDLASIASVRWKRDEDGTLLGCGGCFAAFGVAVVGLLLLTGLPSLDSHEAFEFGKIVGAGLASLLVGLLLITGGLVTRKSDAFYVEVADREGTTTRVATKLTKPKAKALEEAICAVLAKAGGSV
jgi:hypothetical protein